MGTHAPSCMRSSALPKQLVGAGLVEAGVIAGGMIPKVDCCIRCLSQGVAATHIIDGRQPHSLLMELLTDEGVGSMIVGS